MTRKILPLPPAARVRELLDYNPRTGIFKWRVSRGTAKAGSVAGWTHSAGYVYIRVDGIDYKAHRLAWLHYYGVAPADLIDHKDRDNGNNRINNLREATHAQNQQNKKVYANNKSGHKGVSWYPLRRKWRVRIQHNTKPILVGFFDTIEEAIKARKKVEKKLHTHAANIF
jgi:hypothetical protein